jgi:hypothetical protein
MNFLSPIAALIAAGIFVPALVALYFLKLRRRQVTISSTLLWKKAIHDLEVNAPFQRLRRNLLLLLQLVILLALLVAFARPTMMELMKPGQRVVIVIDRSGSMRATDVKPTRLDEAQRLALQIIDEIGGNALTGSTGGGSGGAMIVSVAQQARVVQPFTTDRSLLRQAVRGIEATDQKTNLASAWRLIEPFALEAAGSSGQSLVLYVISDGRGAASEAISLRGAEVRYIRVGTDQPSNVGIVALSARRSFEEPSKVQVFARLGNDGSEPRTANLTLKLDDRVQSVTPVTLPAAAPGGESGSQSVKFDLAVAGAGVVQLRLDADDALYADNVAHLVLTPPRQMRVLLVTQGNVFLERALRATGVQQLAKLSPELYESADESSLRRGPEGYDLIVFDRYSPRRMPLVGSLSFAGVPPITGLSLRPGTSSRSEVALDWSRQHALLRWVAMEDLVMSSPGRLVLPDGATVLATGQSGPIMAEVSADGQRHVVASLDVLRSNWPMQVSFAVFMSNAVQHLGLGAQAEAGAAYATGEVAVVPTDGSIATVEFRGPAPLAAAAQGGRAVLPMLERAGLYSTSKGVLSPWTTLAVNLADATESDLRPAASLTIGTATVSADTTLAEVRKEVWRWFVWGALAVLLLEWLVYTRRMHL